MKWAADLFRLQGHYYLLIVNYYSKFIVVENLRNGQFETIIIKCKKVFSQFGIPKVNYGRNGPDFLVSNFIHFQKLGTYCTKLLAYITTNQMA